MTSGSAKAAVGALLSALLALVLVGGVLWLRSTTAKARAHDDLVDRVAQLERSHQALSEEVVRRAEFDRAIREARASINSNLDKVTHEDPVARDYLGERIPDSVRDAFRR